MRRTPWVLVGVAALAGIVGFAAGCFTVATFVGGRRVAGTVMHATRAEFAVQAGDYAVAVDEYREALRGDPEDTEMRLAFAVALHWHNDLGESERQYSLVLIRDRDNAEAHDGIARVLMDRDRCDEALEHCRRAVELKPNDAQARSGLGYVQWKLGNLPEAAREYRVALEIDPADGVTRAALGSVMVSSGQHAKGLRELERTLAGNPEDANAHMWAGEALMGLGRKSEARKHYRAAIALDNDASATQFCRDALRELD